MILADQKAYNYYPVPTSGTQSWGTQEEVAFVRDMREKGRRIVLESMRDHVATRRYDKGVDREAVRTAILNALIAMDVVVPWSQKPLEVKCA